MCAFFQQKGDGDDSDSDLDGDMNDDFLTDWNLSKFVHMLDAKNISFFLFYILYFIPYHPNLIFNVLLPSLEPRLAVLIFYI